MPQITPAPPWRRARRRPTVAVVAVLTAAAITGLPAASSAQGAPAPLGHTDVTADCAEGTVELAGTQGQRLAAGSVVVVSDALTEGGITRELASSTLSVPVPVVGSVPIDEPVRFRSSTFPAPFRLVRTTSVHVGQVSDDTLLHRETLTIDCAGEGPGAVTISSTGPTPIPPTTPSTSSPPTTVPSNPEFATGEGTAAPEPARAVRTTPRYTA